MLLTQSETPSVLAHFPPINCCCHFLEQSTNFLNAGQLFGTGELLDFYLSLTECGHHAISINTMFSNSKLQINCFEYETA